MTTQIASRLSPETATLGATRVVVVVDHLTRTQIVQYAGASGDFNPLHTDENYATQVAGYVTPVAHGMLTMGLTGRAVTDWLGEDSLTSFGVRFLAPVVPGDTLSTHMVIDALEDRENKILVRVAIETQNADGTPVLRGYASALLTR